MKNIVVDMSDNEDLLGDDLGDHSLADYNLGNDEEEELLADDYESGPQNVPTSIDPNYNNGTDSSEFSGHALPYSQQPLPYQPPVEECVVPNITVEVPNTPVPTYAPYQPPAYEPELAVVPPAIPAAPIESPQIVPSELPAAVPNGEPRERFHSERPAGAPPRTPQLRDIPDSLDKVFVPRGVFAARARAPWRRPPYGHGHPYRRHNVHRGHFLQQRPFTPLARPAPRPDLVRPDLVRHGMVRPDLARPDLARPDLARPDLARPDLARPDLARPGPMRLDAVRPDLIRPEAAPQRPDFRPPFQSFPRFFRPPVEERYPRPPFPGAPPAERFPAKREPEVRMLPVQLPQLPPHLPPHLPAGLAGKKVLINPHFKGNFQPPVDGIPTYIPTRIQKSPPLSPTLETKFGPIKDIDDAAERFIAEQRNALARAAGRKFPRRSPQRYIENTTIEIDNELAGDADLLRRQEEFIHANRAGLRRRMRSPTPPRSPPRSPARSPPRSPPRSPERRRRERPPPSEESEYKRRVREQETLRERVLRAKEVRRRKNAVALHKQLQERERERTDSQDPKPEPRAPEPKDRGDRRPEPRLSPDRPSTTRPELDKPDTTRLSPDRDSAENIETLEKVEKPKEIRDRSPVKDVEVNSTCENLTPPRPPRAARALTPPLPAGGRGRDSDDDDLAFILGDIDDILSDDDDSGRFKGKPADPPKPKPVDLRSKLPPKAAEAKRPPRQKIVFSEPKEQKKRKDKSPPAKKQTVTSSTKMETDVAEKKPSKLKQSSESHSAKPRPRIVFDKKEPEKEEDKSKPNRRVVLQRKIQTKEKSVFSRIEVQAPAPPGGPGGPARPPPGLFSRAVRTAVGAARAPEPEVACASGSEDEDRLLDEDSGMVASVANLPHGITDTRLRTLAGGDVQSLVLDKEDRSARISFKTTVAAAAFRRKFDGKMVAASRLTVTLR